MNYLGEEGYLRLAAVLRDTVRRIRAGSYRFIYEVLEREVVGLVVSKAQRAEL